MSKQSTSWVDVFGHPQLKGLVGQIYFPYNNDELDDDDIEKLDSLRDKYLITTLGARVHLRFEGHCDLRGNRQYNRNLGLRRANTVQAYFDQKLKIRSNYFSSSVISFGERYAGQKNIELDRRVDIFSSFVPKRPPRQLPAIYIQGKIPEKYVRRPVQLFISAYTRLLGGDQHTAELPKTYYIIIEKYASVKESFNFPYNRQLVDQAQHSIVPIVNVERITFSWRKPKPSDTAKSVGGTVLNIISSMVGTSGGYDFGEGIQKLEPPNIVYLSWDDFRQTHPKTYQEFIKYKGRPF